MENKLRKCPFCGSDGEIYRREHRSKSKEFIEQNNCELIEEVNHTLPGYPVQITYLYNVYAATCSSNYCIAHNKEYRYLNAIEAINAWNGDNSRIMSRYAEKARRAKAREAINKIKDLHIDDIEEILRKVGEAN